ncbi:universal stress protein [Paraburkholderia phosphatilytica]|uniref:universal stress protein n=1 Tax=Paraburkholderia phosphatilytica TaxID=2282883 RepID=UPI000E46941A|nr:universal stress protein [Paraburkholderia phosphatilytica]
MYDRILVALDGSDTASHALDAALDLAKLTGATLQPLYVIDLPLIAFDAPGYDPSIVRSALVEEGRRVTAEATERIARAGAVGIARTIEVSLTGGEDIAHCIELAARDFDADLIVMGTHGRRGMRRLVLGSVAERTVRGAPCPVLLVPAQAACAGANAAPHAVEAQTAS